MNKERRGRLNDVVDILDEAVAEIEDIISDEQDAFDNLPESLQYSSRGENMGSAIDAMGDIILSIEDVKAQISDFEY